MIPETKGKNAVLESVISMANNERIARYNNLLMTAVTSLPMKR